MADRVILGMSGGVDSAVAGLILKDQGYQVECLFMKNWEGDDECTAEQDYDDALAVCDRLDLPLHTVNFSKEYWARVFQHFLREYQAGRTPNPDILCNKEIKFKVFLDFALDLGADWIATGHYARLDRQSDTLRLMRGADPAKDQSYFLYALNASVLTKVLFPIGDIAKTKVRSLAREAHLINARKKDSTGICFIGERNFRFFLEQYLPAQPGSIITIDGKTVGQHRGLMYYTIGQRKGIGVGGGHTDLEVPWYVAEKRLNTNELVIVPGHDHPALYAAGLQADQVHWIQPENLPLTCTAKIRYRQQDVPCTVTPRDNGKITVRFRQPQFAVTPGQSVVFYRDDYCLGGAVIEEALKEIPS
ncbi:MAG: tRNA 2-thiouridine(34) synthase MnmA [Fidelibacterota bacterium]